MTLRSLWFVALTLSACELPQSNGPAPVGSAMTPTRPTATVRPTAPLSPREPLKPTEPSDPPPSDPPPSTSESGPLAGLRPAQNQVRAQVGAPPLAWSETVARVAQDWANQLKANSCQLAHRPNNKYGENIFWTSSPVTAEEVVASWVGESASYDAAANTCAQGQICGHYTQVIWSATTSIGCGMASCGNQQVWVCDYDPPGNVLGQKP